MTKTYTPQEILALPMPENDGGAATIGQYFVALLHTLWVQNEGFSGKRPFGNSGWDSNVEKALIRADAVSGSLDEDGYISDVDYEAADKIIRNAIQFLFKADWAAVTEYKEPEDWYVVYFGLDGAGSPIIEDSYWSGRTQKDAEKHAEECNKEGNTSQWTAIHIPKAS